MAAPPATQPTFFDTLQRAAEGDHEMIRQLVGTVGTFSVRLLVAAIILVVTLWAADKLAKLTNKGVESLNGRHHPADKTLSSFISTLVRYVVITIGAIAVLGQLGVQTTSVLAVLGAASLAIGLALQGTLSNVAAGVMILVLRPYRVGDRVELNGRTGKVAHLDLFNTRVLGYDGLTSHIPNGKVFGETIINIDQAGRRRIEHTVGIDYEDDIDQALGLLLKIAADEDRVMPEPKPKAHVSALADSSVSVTLECWTHPNDWADTKFDLLKTIKTTFEAEGLSFPYPHQVAVDRPAQYLRKAAAPDEAEAEAGADPNL